MSFEADTPVKTNIVLSDVVNMKDSLAALRELEKGTSYPSDPTGGMLCIRTDLGSTGRVFQRNVANSTWNFLFDLGEILDRFASGTKMVFFQASAPTYWTKDTTHNDKMLRVVSGSGGGNGGSASPITHTHTTGDKNLTIAQLAAHSHVYAGKGAGESAECLDAALVTDNIGVKDTSIVGSGAVHNHGVTGAFTPYYIDVIVCTKD